MHQVLFCLLGNRSHIGFEEFKAINWLNALMRGLTNASAQVFFKFFHKKVLPYMAEIYTPVTNNGIGTRNRFLKLKQYSRRTKQGQNCLSYVGPSIWNKLPDKIKESNSLNNFKHKIKDHFLKEKMKRENNIYAF